MAPIIPWTELDDSNSDDELDEEVISVSGPGTGHHYLSSFMVGDITIMTSGDFEFHYDELYNFFLEVGFGDSSDAIWSNIARDIVDTSNPDEMDAAAHELIMLLDLTPIDPSSLNIGASTSDVIDHAASIEEDFKKLNLQAHKEELTLDAFDTPFQDTSFKVEIPNGTSKSVKNTGVAKSIPPLCPHVPLSDPKWLIFSSRVEKLDFQARYEWKDHLKTYDPDFPTDEIDTYYDHETISTSRSNSRPSKMRSLLIVYENGFKINIGSHGYTISEDIVIDLEFSSLEMAISEVLSAPGGEGLTCPTPSHILHQIVSSMLSSSMVHNDVVVEPGISDIMIPPDGKKLYHKLHIDITTSAGIWNKKLIADPNNKKTISQAAASKYDLSAVFLQVLKGDALDLFFKAVANCLHCEFPAIYRIDEEDVPPDLKVQASIYDCIASLPQKRLQFLAAAAHEAVVREGTVNMQSVDIHKQGMPWRDKRDVLVRAIDSHKSRSNIAMPPVPMGEIVPLPAGSISVEIRGHHFQSGPYLIQGTSQGPSYRMDDCDNFLSSYPVVGIVSHDDAKELANLLDESPIEVTGMSHKGPISDYIGPDSNFSIAADEIYSKSGQAQLSEIRADLTRAVYNLPMPKVNCWSQCYLYKGKVCCWYRCRDPPNSPDGYRIDWFAISSFPVIGSSEIRTCEGETVHLWPRQRIRSQELQLAHDGPRRLKATLYSMLEKMNASGGDIMQLYLAWTRLNTTLNSSTYGSGKEYITIRFLSATISSPSSPFHKMAKKLVDPITFADVFLLARLRKVLQKWSYKEEYRDKSAILGLPRSYCQLESYWMLWVPSEFASRHQSMVECVINLRTESQFLEDTQQLRMEDLKSQRNLLEQPWITIDDLRDSIRSTCDMEMGGQMGWSWIGSLASGHALNQNSSASHFDRRYSRGHVSRNATNHLTVRHSARVDKNGNLQKGTVAEMMLDQGIDDFLSITTNVYRFLFINRPVFFNHPKKGEHKPREISITDPDSRICLSDAELICGLYGKTTSVDYLKDSAKNSKFYRTSNRVITRGGGIQSSDATRYGPSMSNFAIAIMLLLLGSFSIHLRWASVVYSRLAYRQMLIPTDIIPTLEKFSHHDDRRTECLSTLEWINKMPVLAYQDGTPVKGYCTSHHMGQGMSHHSSSLLHSGGILCSSSSASRAEIKVRGVLCSFNVHIMVTSDDSTVLVEPYPQHDHDYMTRKDKQIAARIYLQLLRSSREIGLRVVSVCPNLVKEIISAVKGEFNSQDTGIGVACPILGFREMISLLVVPSSPSLVGDYINGFSIARDISLAGQGLSTGCYVHQLQIDAIEERWKLTDHQKIFLLGKNTLPKQLITGAEGSALLSSPSALLHPTTRAAMLKESIEVNAESPDLDPHTRDSVFAPMMHVKVSMSKQHKKAITCIKAKIKRLKTKGRDIQAEHLDQSLHATLSSARTRNMGRIAFRVRNRKVRPRQYRDIEFEQNTMIEATFNWISHMEERINSIVVSGKDINLANSIAGHIILVSQQASGYPRPPRLRRFTGPPLRKPRFITETYGHTPFGKHAIIRSGVSQVKALGYAEREIMLKYLAQIRHRKFSEHVEYGGTFVISWSCMSGGKIVAIGNSNEWSQQKREHIKKGDFSDRGVTILKDLSEKYDSTPVLALHSYDGITGIWHCIHQGISYNVVKRIDLELHDSNAVLHQTETGQNVLLAIQGLDDAITWKDTVPTKKEIHDYQHSPYNDHMPDIARSVENQNILEGSATSVTYSTEIEYHGERTLIYTAPEIRQTPAQNTQLLSRVPQLRAKVIASLSTAGYWYTSLRGVAFRAFLRGSYCGETVWTGGVIGWRSSATTIPTYYNNTSHAIGVKAVLIMGGYDNIEQLSSFNPDIRTSGYKAVCESNTETYSRAIQVSANYIQHIIHANHGKRYHYNYMGATFLSMEHPDLETLSIMPTASSAVDAIISMLSGNEDPDVW